MTEADRDNLRSQIEEQDRVMARHVWSEGKVYSVGDVVTIDAPMREPWWARLLVGLRLRRPREQRRMTGHIVAVESGGVILAVKPPRRRLRT